MSNVLRSFGQAAGCLGKRTADAYKKDFHDACQGDRAASNRLFVTVVFSPIFIVALYDTAHQTLFAAPKNIPPVIHGQALGTEMAGKNDPRHRLVWDLANTTTARLTI